MIKTVDSGPEFGRIPACGGDRAIRGSAKATTVATLRPPRPASGGTAVAASHPLLSLALPKNGIHAIFGLYVFAKQKRMHLSQPAPRRARPPKAALAFGQDIYSCHAPGGCYIFSLTPLTRAITSLHAGQNGPNRRFGLELKPASMPARA
jgi:hypothetical protein